MHRKQKTKTPGRLQKAKPSAIYIDSVRVSFKKNKIPENITPPDAKRNKKMVIVSILYGQCFNICHTTQTCYLFMTQSLTTTMSALRLKHWRCRSWHSSRIFIFINGAWPICNVQTWSNHYLISVSVKKD